ncbi:MAG: hypothetical protein AAGF86_18735 [Pseudomonadota bacterium]
MSGRWYCALTGSILILLVCVTPASAHAFKDDGGFYELFLEGNKAVFLDLRVAISVLAAGLLVALWTAEGLIKAWPFFLGGNVAGVLLCAAGMPDPSLVLYGLTLLCGLGAAAAVSLPALWMRGIAVIMGAVPGIAVLFDHTLGNVPIGFILGLFFGLNLVLATAAGLVSLTLEHLPYGWVRIAWRAIAAWLVAITIMILAVELAIPQPG